MSTGFLEALAWMLLHSLWQAGAIGAVLWVALRRMPSQRPELRYALSVAGLIAVVLCAVVTLAMLSQSLPVSGAVKAGSAPGAPAQIDAGAATLVRESIAEPAAASAPTRAEAGTTHVDPAVSQEATTPGAMPD